MTDHRSDANAADSLSLSLSLFLSGRYARRFACSINADGGRRKRLSNYRFAKLLARYMLCALKPAFHDADTDTDILARIVARMSACRSACHRNNFRESRVSELRM